MKKRFLWFTIVALAASAAWGGFKILRAKKDLVTLNVRNMDVRQVARKLERQTWETILVHKDVEGAVTLNVRKVPLETVLGIIAEQTSSRWTAIYPLYRNKKTLPNLEKVVRGEAEPERIGWTNAQARGFPRGGGPFGDIARSQNNLVSMSLQDKDIGLASFALSRYAEAQIVPEDGATATVRLTFSKTPFPEAVKRLAKQSGRKTTKYYALRSFGRRGGPPGLLADRDGGRDGDPDRRGRGDGEFRPSPEREEEMRKRFEALQETMTPEERQRAEEMRQRFEEMRNLPPEQRRQRFEQMAQSPEFQQRVQTRMLSGIKNTTPEQRAERDRRRAEARQRREQQGR